MKGFGPREDVDWSPATSGNAVSWNGAAVVKAVGERSPRGPSVPSADPPTSPGLHGSGVGGVDLHVVMSASVEIRDIRKLAGTVLVHACQAAQTP